MADPQSPQTPHPLPPQDDGDDEAHAPRPKWLGVFIVVMMVLVSLGVANVGRLILRDSPSERAQAARVATNPELQRAMALVQASDCSRCHMAERKAVGPGYLQIAERYAGDAGAQAMLAAKIRGGAVGNWGATVMPRHPQISEADALAMAGWVMSHAATSAAADAASAPASAASTTTPKTRTPSTVLRDTVTSQHPSRQGQ